MNATEPTENIVIRTDAADTPAVRSVPGCLTLHQTIAVNGLDIFYREAGPTDAPTLLLLHGFPTSSHMFRNLIPALADKYHVIAPDYPGFGHSAMPRVVDFEYTFEGLADVIEGFLQKLELERYSLYVMDYGAPVGFRIAARHPERVQSLIIQNGNAYEEGLGDFWNPVKAFWKRPSEINAAELQKLLTLEGTRWQYTHGARRGAAISPDNWVLDQALLDRPGNQEIQAALFYDYRTNPPLYPRWQEYFRQHQPPTLIMWGQNDPIFLTAGAQAYRRDLPNPELHLLDTGHFALEEEGASIAAHIRAFLAKQKLETIPHRTT